MFIFDDDPIFNRSKYFNIGLSKVSTPILVLYDSDILLPIDSYLLGRNKILEGYDMYLPFSDVFFNIDENNKNIIRKSLNLDDISIKEYDKPGCGGACFMNTEIYKFMGGDDENIKGWGPDDNDRIYFMKKLGLKISDIMINYYENDLIYLNNKNYRRFGFFSKLSEKLPMYHLTHPIQTKKKETNIKNWTFFYKKINMSNENYIYYHYLKSKFRNKDGISDNNYLLYKKWLDIYKTNKKILFL